MKHFFSFMMALAMSTSVWAGNSQLAPVVNQGSMHHATLQGLRLEQQPTALKHRSTNP